MKAQVGKIVHYTDISGTRPEPIAAIITGVSNHPEGQRVSLHVFEKNGQHDVLSVPFSEEYKAGYWSWPAVEN